MRVDASTMLRVYQPKKSPAEGGAHHIRDFLKVAHVFSQVTKRARGNLVRRPSITTPHSRISKRRRGVSPGRQLHEEEFGALPPHLSAKARNSLFTSWVFTPSPNKNCVFWHWHLPMGHHIPSPTPIDLGFSKPGCQNPGIWCAHPLPRHQIPESRKCATAFPQLTEPPNRNVVPGTGPQQPQTLTATALGGCPCR